MKICTVPNCTRPHHAKGLCDAHYRAQGRGSVSMPVVKASAPAENKPPLHELIFSFIRKQQGEQITFELLSDHFSVPMGLVRAAVRTLLDEGKNVHINETYGTVTSPEQLMSESEDTRIDVRKFAGEEMAFGFTADNHLCSKYSRMDVLNALFDIWAEQGITRVLQAGNMIDGEARFNRFDLVTRPGLEAQAEYLVNEWPVRKGIVTEFVPGDDHEGWYVQRDGVNIVKYLQNAADDAGRKDMVFKAYMEHTYILNGENGHSAMSIQHAGGGSAYATSYTVQKIVESYQPNEKPAILLVGHFHKAEFGYPRSVLTVQAGCTQDQSPFMRKKRIEAMVGGWTLRFTVDNNGIVHGFAPQWHPFYDRDFYHRWSYLWKPKRQLKVGASK